MKKLYSYGLVVFCMLLGLFFIQPVLFPGASSAHTPDKADIRARLQRISVPFVANQGQTDKQVMFYAATFGGTVFVTDKREIVYSLPRLGGEHSNAGAVIKEKPLNAKKRVVFGEERARATVNYFKGNDKTQWKKDLPTYDVVSLGEVFTGVDLKLRAYGSNVEKLFYVRPQAEPGKIAMTVEGAQRLQINNQGELEAVTAQGPVKFTKPVAYQEINGKRVEVAAAYTIIPQSASRNPQLTYGFTIGPYDRTKELVIDPLLASTYLGGTDLEGSQLSSIFAMSIAVALNGDIYVAGFTDSLNFPTVSFPPPSLPTFQATSGGGRDAFISRFDRGLTNLVASTYLGGSGTDAATSLAIDNAGNVFVAGHTNSANFPTVPVQAAKGGVDAFVAKLNADLTTLPASVYLGGTGDDQAFALILDATNVYVAGDTTSADFPVTPGSADTAFNSLSDAFLSKFVANDLTTPSASTYLGGSGIDRINAMAIKSPNIFVVGNTSSADLLVSPIQSFHGGTDAFVAAIDNTLGAVSIVASTYLGGAGEDHAYSIGINPAGDVFVAGDTSSPGIATVGAYDTAINTGVDGFAAKLNANLTSLTLTYLGGSGDDHAYSLAVNGANLYVAGDTTSTDFPVVPGSYDTTSNGQSDTFLSKLNDTLTALSASTYLGGSGADFANAIALDIFGNVYLTGFTLSANLPTSATAYQTSNFGFSDAFVSEFDANLSFAPAIPDTTAPSVPTNLTATAASDTRITLLWTASTDNVGVTGYEVWRDNARIAIATTNSYSDTGLTPSTTYTYTVKAFDAANNTSAASNPASATTLALGASDIEPPTAPANLNATAVSDSRISLSWTLSTDNVGVSGYDVYRGTTKIATVTTTSYSDGGLTPSTSYTYTVKAVDGAGNVSVDSNAATATTLGAAAGGGGGGGGGGCFIATAAYGSYMADDVMVLRRFRDDYLLTNAAGRAFVDLYYTWSPPVANFIARHETTRTVTRAALSPLVYGVKYPIAAMLMLLMVGMGGTAAILRRRRVRG